MKKLCICLFIFFLYPTTVMAADVYSQNLSVDQQQRKYVESLQSSGQQQDVAPQASGHTQSYGQFQTSGQLQSFGPVPQSYNQQQGNLSNALSPNVPLLGKQYIGQQNKFPFVQQEIIETGTMQNESVYSNKNKLDPSGMSRLEKSLNEPPLLIEDLKPQIAEREMIEQFGYNFFKKSPTGVTSQLDVPVSTEYVIGIGDRLVITVWGSIDGSYTLEVNRSGEILLPKVGPIKVAGVPYGQLSQVIRANLAKVFKDFQLNVNIGSVRLIKVFIVGEVESPGDYNLSSLTTVLAALANAGGPTRNGTLRNIQIKRGGTLLENVDLYDFFLRGDKSRDLRLQSGDTLFIPQIGAVAAISGNVRRPAIYELKTEKTLKDLIDLAGGINSSGFLQRVQVSRVEEHDRKMVSDFSLDPKITGKSVDELTSQVPLKDMDSVKVSRINSLLRNYVRLEGYVLRPGDYALSSGMHISDLLTRDNILPEYFAESAQLIRLTPPDLHPEAFIFSPAKAIAGDGAHNLLLKEFDKIKIFARSEMEEIPKVRIYGEVQKPGEYRLYNGMTVRDLLILAGNPKRTAYLKQAEITRIKKDGEAVSSYSININIDDALKGVPESNIVLHPYDDFAVRKIPNWADRTEKYITLKGEFVFPGVYPIYRGEKLDSVIRRAGGFTEKAYLPGAKFTREHIREMQQQRMEEVLAREEVALAKKQAELSSVAASKDEIDATKAALEGMMKSIDILKKKKAEGRMVINLPPLEQLKDSDYNFEVMGGDSLEINIDPKMISVVGQVYNPNTFIYTNGESVADYLAKSGGFTRDAETADAYVIKSDGTVVSRQMTTGFFGIGSFMSKNMDSGDTLVVPQKLERIAWIRELKDVATIIGQLALAAGVIIAIH